SSAVARDGVVAARGRGVAADWGPMTVASKRAEIAAWTRAQSYCRG
ncbi:lytic transglycosylase, partial [Rhodovulum sulfidophilum]|nr:lytic transglycosylase [Rhodovulum sulfidophilum]